MIDRLQAAQVAISPSTTQTVIVDVNPKNNPSNQKVFPVITRGKFLPSGNLLAGLEKIPSIATGVDIAIENDQPDNLHLNCATSPPEMKYLPTSGQNCPALAWAVTNKYLHQTDRAITPHQFTLNPHLAKNIPIIGLNEIKNLSDLNRFKNKVLLVGFIPNAGTPNSLPSVVIQAIATEQIMQNNRPHQSLPTPFFILLWSGFSSAVILPRKWHILLPAGMVLLSLGIGVILFTNGVLVPSVIIVITISTASILISSIRLSNNLVNL